MITLLALCYNYHNVPRVTVSAAGARIVFTVDEFLTDAATTLLTLAWLRQREYTRGRRGWGADLLCVADASARGARLNKV